MLVWVFPFVHSFVLKKGMMQGFRKIAKWGKKTKQSRNNSFSPISTVEWRKIGIFLRLAWIDPRKTCKETLEANKSGYWGARYKEYISNRMLRK